MLEAVYQAVYQALWQSTIPSMYGLVCGQLYPEGGKTELS